MMLSSEREKRVIWFILSESGWNTLFESHWPRERMRLGQSKVPQSCSCFLKTALAGSQFQVVGKELNLTTVRKLTVTGSFLWWDLRFGPRREIVNFPRRDGRRKQEEVTLPSALWFKVLTVLYRQHILGTEVDVPLEPRILRQEDLMR